MSKYYVNKFLYTVDRDPDLLRRYIDEPSNLVASWEQSVGPVLCGNAAELSTVHVLNEDERDALAGHDFVALFEMGAHFFLNLTIFIGSMMNPTCRAQARSPFNGVRQKIGSLEGQAVSVCRDMTQALDGSRYPM